MSYEESDSDCIGEVFFLCHFFFHKLFGDMEISSLLAAVVMFSYHTAEGIR